MPWKRQNPDLLPNRRKLATPPRSMRSGLQQVELEDVRSVHRLRLPFRWAAKPKRDVS